LIATAVISSTLLDRGAFMPAAQHVTGENHVAKIDAHPGLSRLHDDLLILKDFADIEADLHTSVFHIGVLVAGFEEDISAFIALTRGFAHLPTSQCKRGIRAVVISGSLNQWRNVIIEGSRTSLQAAFNNLYKQFFQLGLGWVFKNYKHKETPNGQFLLEHK